MIFAMPFEPNDGTTATIVEADVGRIAVGIAASIVEIVFHDPTVSAVAIALE